MGMVLGVVLRQVTMLNLGQTTSLSLLAGALLGLSQIDISVNAISTQSYKWNNVKIGGGGGFVPGIVFNPSQKGLAFARTDIGGAYKLNADNSWTALLDFADNARWNYWGTDALATDPVDPDRLYIVRAILVFCGRVPRKYSFRGQATGMYTNSWDPNNGQILVSKDQGNSFTASPLPFKVGGNMPGRGLGEVSEKFPCVNLNNSRPTHDIAPGC